MSKREAKIILKFLGKEVKQLAVASAYKDEHGVRVIQLEELLWRIDHAFNLEETA